MKKYILSFIFLSFLCSSHAGFAFYKHPLSPESWRHVALVTAAASIAGGTIGGLCYNFLGTSDAEQQEFKKKYPWLWRAGLAVSIAIPAILIGAMARTISEECTPERTYLDQAHLEMRYALRNGNNPCYFNILNNLVNDAEISGFSTRYPLLYKGNEPITEAYTDFWRSYLYEFPGIEKLIDKAMRSGIPMVVEKAKELGQQLKFIQKTTLDWCIQHQDAYLEERRMQAEHAINLLREQRPDTAIGCAQDYIDTTLKMEREYPELITLLQNKLGLPTVLPAELIITR